jgi:hypothetical protein
LEKIFIQEYIYSPLTFRAEKKMYWGLAFCVVILLLALWIVWKPMPMSTKPGTINVAVTATTPALATASPSGTSAPGQAASTAPTAATTAAAAPSAPAAAAAAVQEYLVSNRKPGAPMPAPMPMKAAPAPMPKKPPRIAGGVPPGIANLNLQAAFH